MRSYVAWSLLPSTQGVSKHSGITTPTWPPCRELLQPFKPVSQAPEAPVQLHPASQKYRAHKAYTEVISSQDYFLNNKQNRHCGETAGVLWELSGDCRDSPGSEVAVSTIYDPLYLHRLRRGSDPGVMTYLQGHCSTHSQTHRPKLFQPRTKTASRINKALLYAPASPPEASPAW